LIPAFWCLSRIPTKDAGLELRKTGYYVLVYYVNTINNTRNVNISQELGGGGGAGSSLCNQTGGLFLR
jgi:hypothetical protein